MSRRNARHSRRNGGTAGGGVADPFVVLGFDRAWRAEDAVDNGTNTTALPSYIGSALSLAAFGTGQAVKAASANFPGRHSIVCDGLAGSNGYGAVALGGAPTSLTIASVARITAVNGGIAALTAGGTVNSGEAQFYASTTLRARKFGSPNADVTIALPCKVVTLTVFDVNGTTHYVNSLTPVTAASVAALAGTTFQVMALASAGSLVLTGEWCTSGYALRAFTPTEAASWLTLAGLRYGVTVAP
jgi:hypothetical protein